MLSVLAWCSLAYWVAQALLVWRTRRALPVLASLSAPPLARWPIVSTVVPARNEGTNVRAALADRLAEGYPALEVVLVDDRSTDDTGDQARALGDPRVQVLRLDALPPGWLGKVHAMHRGVGAAKGEWLFFSDADVHLAPGTLARVVAWAEHAGVDHVAALPRLRPGGWLTQLSLEAFMRFITTVPRLWKVQDPASKAAVGVGAFNLVRRAALERTPGLEWLKMEIADDMALGVMLKRAGARQRVVLGQAAVSLQFYPSFGAMARALEKNGATAPLPVMLVALALLSALELGWLAGLGGPVGWLTAGLAVGTGLTASGMLDGPRWPALLPGLGMLPLAAVMARSALLAAWRGGVVWRGTFYSTKVVRAGSRLR